MFAGTARGRAGARGPDVAPRVHLRPRAAHASSGVSRPDLLALGALALLPVLVYVPTALAGHALLPGDDLTQNYPLRVLAGELLRAGHLPGWDPYIWSGTPLLAGWNAGALFPGTVLFAFLPGLVAWTANLVAVGVVSGTGLYLFLRRLSCGPLAAFLAALVFTYTGFMSGQIVHVGLVQGTSLMPWVLLAADALAFPGRPLLPGAGRGTATGAPVVPSPWTPTGRDVRWGALLALATALTVLAGDPRAVSSSAIAVGIYVVSCSWRLGRSLGPALAKTVASGAVGIALGAVQWLPGLAFLHASQRGQSAFSLFQGGSLALTEIGALLALPFALGGNGNFGLPVYSGDYNLPEVTIGVGLVALVAAFALLPDALAPLRARLRPRHARPGPPGARRALGVWYATGAVGTVLALGSYTPLAHALVLVPLFGGERLQNRNVVLLDLALVVLLAFFLDDLLGRRLAARGPVGRTRAGTRAIHGGPLGTTPRRLLAVVPLVATGTLVLLAFVAPVALEDAIGVVVPGPGMLRALSPYFVASGVTAAALAGLVLAWRRLGQRARRSLLVVFVLADVATYVANASYASAPPGSLAPDGPGTEALRAVTGPSGRFAIYNPFYGGTGTAVFSLGVTDLNLLRHLPSVQGYGSIVQGAYQDATGTHAFETLDTTGLSGPLYDSLDLAALVTLPSYLEQPIAPGSPVPLPDGRAVRVDGTPAPARSAPARPLGASGPWAVRPGTPATWFLPSPTALSSVHVVLEPGSARPPAAIEVGVAESTGRVRWRSVPVVHGVAALATRRAAATARVEVRARASAVTVGAVVAAQPARRPSLVLDGELQGLLASPHWRWAATIDGLAVFANTRARGAAWLEAPGARSPDAPVVRSGTTLVTPGPTTGSEIVRVTSARAATLVRSTTFARGWTAHLTPVGGGRSRVETVTRLGLVEAVPVPAGRWVVTWRYAPESTWVGLLVSAAAALVLLAGVAGTFVRRRDRRSGRRGPGAR
nr:hypothetical protein [Actinomycetota bacterium]